MGIISFEGDPPYDLPLAQTAEARSEGEIVDLILTVSAPDIQPEPVPMTWKKARELGGQLGPAALAAEMRARGLGH